MRRNFVWIVGGVLALVLTLLVVGGGISLVQNFDSVGEWYAGSNTPITCAENDGCRIVHPIVYGLVVVLLILTGFAYTTLLERKVLAWIQQRVGPNRVGPMGLLQPLADAIKLIFKEDIIPDKADKPVYYLAPLLKAVPALIVVAVIPLGPDIVFPWLDGNWYLIPLGLADVNVGVLYLLAITSLGTYGVVLAGWSSNNKYAMLGGLRATAQMISYELILGLSLAVPIMLAGSMSIGDIIDSQKNVWEWFIFQNPLAAALLTLALFAEIARSPFDLVEAEQELTAGFMTEYSGMKFAMFMMAEYIGMVVVSILVTVMFLGGYHLFPMDTIGLAAPLVLIGKVAAFLFFIIWVRGTLPRVRYDRLMALGWKVLLPLAFVSVAWTAIAVVLRESSFELYGVVSAVFFIVVVAGGFYFLREDQGEEAEGEDDWADDPLITGQRRGFAWNAINILGGVLAIPFVLIEGLIKALDGFGNAMDPTDENAIVPTDQSGGD